MQIVVVIIIISIQPPTPLIITRCLHKELCQVYIRIDNVLAKARHDMKRELRKLWLEILLIRPIPNPQFGTQQMICVLI